MEKERFSISSQLTKKDFRRMMYLAVFGRDIRIPVIVAVLSAIGGGVITLVADKPSWGMFFLFWFIMFLLCVGVVNALFEKKNQQILHAERYTKKKELGPKVTVSFFEEQLEVRADKGETKQAFRYDELEFLLENPQYLIVYLTPNEAFIVRMRDLPQEKSLAKFHRFVEEKMGKKYRYFPV